MDTFRHRLPWLGGGARHGALALGRAAAGGLHPRLGPRDGAAPGRRADQRRGAAQCRATPDRKTAMEGGADGVLVRHESFLTQFVAKEWGSALQDTVPNASEGRFSPALNRRGSGDTGRLHPSG